MCSFKEKNSPTSSKNVNFVVESKIEMTAKRKLCPLIVVKYIWGKAVKRSLILLLFLRVTLHSQNDFSPSKTSHGVEVIM